MQPFPTPIIPDWSYQPPLAAAKHIDQLYYRAHPGGSYSIHPRPAHGDAVQLRLFRFVRSESAELTVKFRQHGNTAEVSVDLDPAALCALRDACNDALADIAVERGRLASRVSDAVAGLSTYTAAVPA